MPCTYYTPEEEARIEHQEKQKLKAELDKVTRLLCEVMTEVENEYHPQFSKEIKDWWKDHQEKDKARLKAEEAVLKLAKEMQLAKEKKERKLLAELKKKYEPKG